MHQILILAEAAGTKMPKSDLNQIAKLLKAHHAELVYVADKGYAVAFATGTAFSAFMQAARSARLDYLVQTDID